MDHTKPPMTGLPNLSESWCFGVLSIKKSVTLTLLLQSQPIKSHSTACVVLSSPQGLGLSVILCTVPFLQNQSCKPWKRLLIHPAVFTEPDSRQAKMVFRCLSELLPHWGYKGITEKAATREMEMNSHIRLHRCDLSKACSYVQVTGTEASRLEGGWRRAGSRAGGRVNSQGEKRQKPGIKGSPW